MPSRVRLEAVVERHHPDLPRYVVVPSSLIASWKLEGTTTVEGTIDGASLGRRSLKRWDDERWFLDLPSRLCELAGASTGDTVHMELWPASTKLPDELIQLLSESPRAKRRWEEMSASRQRMVREEILAAKRSSTRRRRACRALGLDASSS